MAIDVYQIATDRIIAALKSGTVPWRKPWVTSGGCISHSTGRPYSLLNQLLLSGREGEYATFKQISEEGGHVRKGEKSSIVVFWKMLEQQDRDTGETRIVPYLRYYNVFHIDQCEGIRRRFATDELPPEHQAQAEPRADRILADYIARTGVTYTQHRSSESFYSPGKDEIVIPLREQFENTAEYYSTVFHECAHSTGHPSRLDRDLTHRFGTAPYAKEELCAELTASYFLNIVGIETPSSFRNNAAYIQSWLKQLRDDRKLIVSAAGKAEKAVQFILNEPSGNSEILSIVSSGIE